MKSAHFSGNKLLRMFNKILSFFRSGKTSDKIFRPSNPALKTEVADGHTFVVFPPHITRQDISGLLEELRSAGFEIAFHDTIHPTLSDPGACFSYSTQKNIDNGSWSMTCGNHGWSDGIFQIRQETLTQQIFNLVSNGRMDRIQITEVCFFSHYALQSQEKSAKKDNEIFQMHAT